MLRRGRSSRHRRSGTSEAEGGPCVWDFGVGGGGYVLNLARAVRAVGCIPDTGLRQRIFDSCCPWLVLHLGFGGCSS